MSLVLSQLELYDSLVLIRIDTTAAEPIYAQIAHELRRAILRGEVAAGERLPSARELASALDVNMHTVLRAYTELRDAGEIELRRGRGAVVLADRGLPAEVNKALVALLDAARRHEVPLDRLHMALDEGDRR